MIWDIFKTLASWITSFFSKRSREKKLLEIRQKASLVYEYESNPGPTVDRLHIVNYGLTKARNIEVYIDNTPIKEWEYSIDEDCDFPDIPPSSGISIRLLDDESRKKRYNILIKWEDGSRELGRYEGIFETY